MISYITKTYHHHRLFIRRRKHYSQQPAYPRAFRTLIASWEIVINYLTSFQAGELEKLSVSQSYLYLKQADIPIQDIYNDRKLNLIQERIVEFAQELQDQIDEFVLPVCSLTRRVCLYQSLGLSVTSTSPHLWTRLKSRLDFHRACFGKRKKFAKRMVQRRSKPHSKMYHGLLTRTKQFWMMYESQSLVCIH